MHPHLLKLAFIPASKEALEVAGVTPPPFEIREEEWATFQGEPEVMLSLGGILFVRDLPVCFSVLGDRTSVTKQCEKEGQEGVPGWLRSWGEGREGREQKKEGPLR